jgi:hypothetical protein
VYPKAALIRAHIEPGLPLVSFKPAWFLEKPAWFYAYPAEFTPEQKSGNGAVRAAEPGRDQTISKPKRLENPGP